MEKNIVLIMEFMLGEKMKKKFMLVMLLYHSETRLDIAERIQGLVLIAVEVLYCIIDK